jgi:hypothetical protein
MEGAAQLSSTGTGPNAATITLTGTASSGTGAHGLLSGWAGSTISTVDGAVTLAGSSTSTGNSSFGLHLSPATVRSTGSGDITLNGSTLNGSDVHMNTAVVDGGGADITINANTIDLWVNAISGSGQLTIQPRTPETTIGLGGGAGTLNLDDGELSRLTDGFAAITIGDVTNGTGTVTIDSATFNDPVTTAGGAIHHSPWTSPDMATGTNAVILDGNVSPGPQPGWPDIFNITGDVTLAANHAFTVEVSGAWLGGYGQLDVVGTVTISDNVTLQTVVTNGFIPDGADTLTIINNDGSDPVVGTFAGLSEGGTIPNFIGSGMDATISYSGGDGNDVVLTVHGPEISLWGNGETIYRDDSAYRANHTDFGRVKVDGGTVVRTFTISNTGNLPLNLDGSPLVALSGPDAAAFTVTAAPNTPVTAGTSTTVQITFDPSATGEFTATVSIASDDRNEDPYAFAIKGAGVIPNVSFNGVDCDLIEAINAANSDAPSNDCPAGSGVVTDTITLLSDIILTNYYDYSDNGLPEIASAITVEGAGYTISRTVDAPEFRFFLVGSNGALILNELTLRNGGGTDFDEYGGVLYLYEGSVILNDSAIINNSTAYYAGALYNEYGTLTLNNSTISDNISEYYGGAIYNYGGALTLNSSTISGNISEYYGGAIYSEYGELTVDRSTFSNNSTAYYGGAIYNYDGPLTLTNSTLSGNFAQDYGGAIYNEYGALTLTNSTLTANSADYAGAIYHYDNTLILNRTVLAGNSADSDIAELYNDGGTVNADSFNLLGDSSKTNAQAFYDFTPGATDITATSDGTNPTALAAILDPTLADNGGPTLTHALVPGSPAVDAADDSSLATDQRGVTRPQGAADDIGAVEATVQPATITIVLDGRPDLPTNLGFSGHLGAFLLDNPAVDDSDAYTNTKTFSVAPGTYVVRRNNANTWYTTAIACTPEDNARINLPLRRASITVAAGDNVTCTFTVDRGVTIRARAFNDLVRNRTNLGRRNPGDPWLEGWTINVYSDPSTLVSSGITAVNGAVNEILFSYLPPGDYTVCADLPDGTWTPTEPSTTDPAYGDQLCKPLTLAPGQIGTLLFGAYQSAVPAIASRTPEDDIVTDVDSISDLPYDPAEDESLTENSDAPQIFLPLIYR